MSDRRREPEFFEKKIRHIEDAELFAAMDFDFAAGYRAWADHWGKQTHRGLFMGEGESPPAGELLMTRQQAESSLKRRSEWVLNSAEALLANRINGWGDVTIEHGSRVDYNADYGRAGKYGFHYWVWARPLIQAFLLTRDQKYLDKFEDLFNQWYEQRDDVKGEMPDLDVIWYELGLGLRNRFFLQYYLLPHERRSIQTHERMLKTLLGAARWLFEEENRMYRGGNWQIMGSFGMLHIGITIPEFREAKQWVKLGADRLLAHMQEDLYADGCHSERCASSYSMVAYRDSRNLLTLLETRPQFRELTEKAREPLRRMENFFVNCAGPDGYLPGINDSSRGKLPETVRRGSDAPGSVCFADSGFTFMRGPNDFYVLINHGPSGGGHSHADSLSFELHANGKPLAIDSGIGRTYDDPNHVPWYTQSKAHNMLTVDNANLDRRQAEARDVEFASLAKLDYFAGTHYGYAQSHGVTHRRHIALVKGEYVIVYDVAASRADAGDHRLQWHLHRTSRELLVIPPRPTTFVNSQAIASVKGIAGFNEDWAMVEWLYCEEDLPAGGVATIAMLLLPYKGDHPQLNFQATYEGPAGAHYRVTRENRSEDILFAHPGMRLESESISFSGACATIRHELGKAVSWSAVGALELKFQAKTLLDRRLKANREGRFEQ